MRTVPPEYRIVIAARNEESTLPVTLESIVKQTIRPSCCVVASDSSTDRTDEITEEFAGEHDWVRLLRIRGSGQRSFASKSAALNQALSTLPVQPKAYTAFFDADIRMPDDFMEKILSRMGSAPDLGVAGGLVLDPGCLPPKAGSSDLAEVAGATLVIRGECLPRVTPFPEIPQGGFDTITLVNARRHGFKTRAFVDLVVDHLKPRSGNLGATWRRSYAWGLRDYAVGNHPLFEVAKCLSRLGEQPLLLGSVLRASGYMAGALRNQRRVIGEDVVRALRTEQLQRLGLQRRAPVRSSN